jgi:hypothetical protein
MDHLVVEKSPAEHSARIPRRFARPIVITLVLLCLAVGVVQTSCVPVFRGCIEGYSNCENSDWLGRIEVKKPRFEFVDLTLTPSKNFWLKDQEPLRFKWDDYIFLFHAPDHLTCDFMAPTLDTNFCQRCRWCNQDDQCDAQTVPADASIAPALVTLGLDSPNVISSAQLSPLDGCGNGQELTPAQNSTFQLKTLGADQMPLVEAQAFVLSKAQTITYELHELDQSFDSRSLDGSHPPVKFYSGTVPPFSLPTGDGLEDNFSPNLHISKIRILKVTKQILPVKGRTVMDAIPVLPSRLLFFENFVSGSSVFTGDGNICYGDASKTDGDFDLTKCRGAIGSQGMFLAATPAFLGSTATTSLLNWIVEFRESEGAVQPTLDPGNEKLAIEFTIEPS